MEMSGGDVGSVTGLDDATRDACLHGLGDHYAAGRLSAAQLDSLVRLALAAGTADELASVMARIAGDPEDDRLTQGRSPVARLRRLARRTHVVRGRRSTGAASPERPVVPSPAAVTPPAIVPRRVRANDGTIPSQRAGD